MRHAGTRHRHILLALCALATLGACNDDEPGANLPGDTFFATLTVTLAGTGSGTVSAAGVTDFDNDEFVEERYFEGFVCRTSSSSCEEQENLDREGADSVRFDATPDAGSIFVSWSGECVPSKSPTTAFVYMDTERPYECTATFELVTAACTNPLVIEDSFSTDAGWTTTFSATTANASQTVAFQANGGNPGGFRQFQHVFTGLGALSVYHTYDAVTYDPSSDGAIDHLNYFEDQIMINPPTPGAGVGTGFSVTQGGTRYNIALRPPTNVFVNTAWETTSALDLTAASFPGVDFSASGGPITFGFFRSNTNTGGGAYTLTHGVDNFKVEICR